MAAAKWKMDLDPDLAGIPEEGPVFGTRGWLEASRRALPFRLEILRILKGDTLVAYLPLQFIRKGALTKAFTPIHTYYGGPYFVAGRRRHYNEEVRERYEALAAALAWLERRSHYCLLLPDGEDARPALARGWRCVPRYTVINDLRDIQSLDGNKDCLANLRKAERAGLRFGPTSCEDAFEAAYARTFARKGVHMAWRPGWAAGLRRELTGTGLMEHWAVFGPDGGAIAFGSVALDRARDTAILWASCSLEGGDRVGAMHFLYRSLVLEYRTRYGALDLCGADNRSLSEFKEKFANRLQVRFSLEKYRGPVTEALLKGFQAARRGLSRVHAGR